MGSNHRPAGLRSFGKALAFLVAAMMLATSFVLPFASSASAQAAAEKPDASVRVLDASPGSPALDVLVNGQPLAKNLAFGVPTSYAPLKEGSYKIQIVPTGQAASSAIAEKDFDAGSGNAYIISIVNPLNNIAVNVDQVNLDAVGSGKARVRVFNDSSDAGAIDLAVTGGDTWFSGVSQGDKSDYKDFDAGTYSLDVRGDNNTTLATATGVDVQDGHVYDMFAIGQISDKSFTLLPLVTSVSAPCATVLGLQGTASDACVRIVHASPGAPAVDVYLNGTLSVKNLGFGTGTDFVVVPAGDSNQVQITATGASLDTALISQNVSLAAGQAYEYLATGTPNDLQLTSAQVDLTPLPAGQARVRVINTSPDAGAIDLGIKNGDKLFDNTDFRQVSDYKVVDATSLTVDALKQGGNQVFVEGVVDLKEAMVYDIVMVGQQADQSLKIIALSAPASTRTGSVATPAVAGTSSPVSTVVSAATSVATTVSLTTPQTTATGQPLTTPQLTATITTVPPTATSQVTTVPATTTPQTITVQVTTTPQMTTVPATTTPQMTPTP